MTKTLTTRIDTNIVKRVENATKKRNTDKASFIRTLIIKGLEEVEREDALECYRKGEISLGKFSELLRLNLWDTIDLLGEKKIHFNYGEDNLREDLGDLLTTS